MPETEIEAGDGRRAGSDRRRKHLPLLLLATAAVGIFMLGWMGGTWRAQAKANPALVAINGDVIRQSDLTHRLEVAGGKNTLKQMLHEQYQLQLAKQQGVFPSEADVEKKYAELSAQPDFERKRAESLETPEDIKYSLRLTLAQQALIGKGVNVTEADARRFYDVQSDPRNPQARYYRPETVTAAAIISDKASDIDAALHELASGAPFASVAQKYSKDSSKNKQGLLPPIRRGQLDPNKFPGLEAALFALNSGQQTDRLHIAQTWWIARCVAHVEEKRVPYTQVKEECRTGAMLARGLQANGQHLKAQSEDFARQAQIVIFAPRYHDAAPGK